MRAPISNMKCVLFRLFFWGLGGDTYFTQLDKFPNPIIQIILLKRISCESTYAQPNPREVEYELPAHGFHDTHG
jgi:hypothetical protein